MVFLTSNNTREISDALKRRCLHLYIPFPTVELEERIIRSRVPDVDEQLRHQLVEFVHSLRQLDLNKVDKIGLHRVELPRLSSASGALSVGRATLKQVAHFLPPWCLYRLHTLTAH